MLRRRLGGRVRRVLAIVILLAGVLAVAPVRVEAASAIVITATDEAGFPLVGAEFAAYDVAPATDGGGASVAGETLVAGPVATGDDGTATLADLPDAAQLAVVQVVVPPGHQPDPAGPRIVTTDPAVPAAVTFVNAVIPTNQAGTIEVGVADGSTGDLLPGVGVQVATQDPATGARGVALETRVTGGNGLAVFTLQPGAYLVGLVELPAGYRYAGGDQAVVVEPPVDGVADLKFLSFDVDPVPGQSQAPEPTAEPPATVVVEAIVCVTPEAERVGTVDFRPDVALRYLGEALPQECRPARAGEFTFRLNDPLDLDNDFDDATLDQVATDVDGYGAFTFTASRTSGTVYVLERDNPYVSPSVAVEPGATTPILAVFYEPVPRGDLTVTMTNAVTREAIPGGCFALAASGAEAVTIAEGCDAGDGAEDGVVVFPDLANGTYLVSQTTVMTDFVPSPVATVEIRGAAVDLAMPATPYGVIEIFAFACPAGAMGTDTTATLTTPTPAAGDSLDDFGSAETGAEPLPPVEFVVTSSNDRSSGDGTGPIFAADAARDRGCGEVAASLGFVAPGGGEPSTVVVEPDGLGARLSVPPSTGGDGYTLRDLATGATVVVPVDPAAISTVTMMTPVADDPAAAAATGETGAEDIAATDAPAPATMPGDAAWDPAPADTAAAPASETEPGTAGTTRLGVSPYQTAADLAELRTVTTLPATGAGPVTTGGSPWALVAVLALVTAAIAARERAATPSR